MDICPADNKKSAGRAGHGERKLPPAASASIIVRTAFLPMPAASPPSAPAAVALAPVRRITAHDTASDNAGPLRLAADLFRYRHLIGQLTRRDALGRYRGSYLGVLWSFLNPLFLLLIFTVVFKLIFKGKFTGRADETPADFALQLFAGLIVFNVFAECLSRAPTLILTHANYVTKVVFPLEILPVTLVLSSLFHLFISLLPLGVAMLAVRGGIPPLALQWPLLLLPMTFFALGLTWLMAALGAFLRDLNQIALALTNLLMYASAVFYPINRVPDSVLPFVRYNPVAFVCEGSGRGVVWGGPLPWISFGWVTAAGALFMFAGYAAFLRVKHAFADVL